MGNDDRHLNSRMFGMLGSKGGEARKPKRGPVFTGPLIGPSTPSNSLGPILKRSGGVLQLHCDQNSIVNSTP